MNLKQAFANKLLDRFEMMTLAEKLADLNQHGKHISSFDDIDFHDGQFVFSNLVDVKKKDVLFYLSMLLSAFLTLSDKRLTSIFMNHYLSCQNEIQFYKYLPKSHRKPFLIACGGLSGSGKSRIAREIAPLLNQPLGAIIIRDDIVRKQLANVPFDTQLDDSYYTDENERLVYREMRRQIKHALSCGHTVIADALFYYTHQIEKIAQLAHRLNVPFDGFWMTASLKTRLERVQIRKNNPSDIKTQQALQKQISQSTGVIWWRVIDTEGPKEQTLLKIRKYVKKYL